ncbi:hypothetical protein CFOL_v3_12714 [Cephalotus follicularis]|uniref:Putative plant transposon protein domain-containing protein n=1 Tax=Cephalotus follicularis TaxID=3775 RepID=A0A1Q3BND4_CEPFO|nr:hypothetical protein CFOL_v3_12714 [Cephalotus follicularis]
MEIREIFVGKTLDFDFCINEGFPIVDWLNAQELGPLFRINLTHYLELMKEFYVNILPSLDVDLYTKVKNREIELDFTTIATILEIPYVGTRAWNQRNWVVDGMFKNKDCERLLFGENTQIFQKMYSRNHSLHHRFLHHPVATHILPKSGGFNEVTHMEAFTMFHIITGQRICVPKLILNHMQAMHARKNARFPYSNSITKILMHFGVNLTGEVHHALRSADKLRKGTLGRMGFKKHKRLGTWVPRDEDSNRVIGEEEEGGEEGGEEVQGEEERTSQVDPALSVNLPSNQFEEILRAIKGLEMGIQTIKRRQKRIERKLVEKGIIGDECITSSSSQEDQANQREEEEGTDDMGHMDGDDEDDHMAD